MLLKQEAPVPCNVFDRAHIGCKTFGLYSTDDFQLQTSLHMKISIDLDIAMLRARLTSHKNGHKLRDRRSIIIKRSSRDANYSLVRSGFAYAIAETRAFTAVMI